MTDQPTHPSAPAVTAAAADRLKALLARPTPTTDWERDDAGFFNPWEAFDGVTPSYDAEIDRMAIRILEAVRDGKNFDLMDEEHARHALFIQFFLHVITGHGYAEYGTSPRAAFPARECSDLFAEWIAKWKAWYLVNWGETDV